MAKRWSSLETRERLRMPEKRLLATLQIRRIKSSNCAIHSVAIAKNTSAIPYCSRQAGEM